MQMVEGQVGGDAVEPRFEGTSTVPLFGAGPDPQKDLLDQVLGRRVVWRRINSP
jgi:hypothetical protein